MFPGVRKVQVTYPTSTIMMCKSLRLWRGPVPPKLSSKRAVSLWFIQNPVNGLFPQVNTLQHGLFFQLQMEAPLSSVLLFRKLLYCVERH